MSAELEVLVALPFDCFVKGLGGPQSMSGLCGELLTVQPTWSDGHLETRLKLETCQYYILNASMHQKYKSVNVWRVVSGRWELYSARKYLVDNRPVFLS